MSIYRESMWEDQELERAIEDYHKSREMRADEPEDRNLQWFWYGKDHSGEVTFRMTELDPDRRELVTALVDLLSQALSVLIDYEPDDENILGLEAASSAVGSKLWNWVLSLDAADEETLFD